MVIYLSRVLLSIYLYLLNWLLQQFNQELAFNTTHVVIVNTIFSISGRTKSLFMAILFTTRDYDRKLSNICQICKGMWRITITNNVCHFQTRWFLIQSVYIVPIPKLANSTTIDKFHPISVLSVKDKVFEKLLCDRVLLYLEENDLLYIHNWPLQPFSQDYGLASHDLLYNHQLCFRKGCGTKDAALNVVKFVMDWMMVLLLE